MSEAERAHVERVVRAREAARHATGTWAAKRELAAALRELLAKLPSTAAPRAPDRGPFREAALVEEDDRGVAASGVFL